MAANLTPREKRLLGALALLLGVVLAVALTAPGDRFSGLLFGGDGEPPSFDPLGYVAGRNAEFELRAATGLAHVLYEKSPGGVERAANRTARYRRLVEAAAARHAVEPDLLEAMVFLESGGRPEVIAGRDVEAAAGLAQILAETGRNLLGMKVDLARSRRLTRSIRRAAKRGRASRARRLRARRRRIDERFDPAKALDAAGRYLAIARRRFGRPDLAVVSYHMGIGNLEGVVRTYAGLRRRQPVLGTIGRREISYARLYFDTSPLRHAGAHARLTRFGDDSANYYWKVLASREIMRLWRSDRDELRRLNRLHRAKASAEEVFHPEPDTEVFEDPGDLEQALIEGKIVPVPHDPPGLAFGRSPAMGGLARRLGRPRGLYRALRPEALATLVYIADRVQAISGGTGTLIVTSGVRDRDYQRLLAEGNSQATREYSLHTTGYAFDIARRYRSRAQALAFQFMLDRLRALAVIDYAVEPAAIHVTVSDGARALLPLLSQ